MKRSASIFVLSFICALCLLCSACASPSGSSDEGAPNTPDAPASSAELSEQETAGASQSPEKEEPYVFPEDGVLKLLADGKAPFTIDGRNPSLEDQRLIVFFDCTYRDAGLQLSENTEITYSFTKKDGTVLQGTAPLDTSIAELKNEYGYVGVCINVGTDLEKYEKATFDLSFKDASGKEYSVKQKTVYKGLSYLGLDASKFDVIFKNKVSTTVGKNIIKQTGTVNNTDFSFTITLANWSGKTTAEQIVTISELFWECYPRMHARFGSAGKSPVDVTLDIEDGGYEIASASDNKVHLHDGWLQQNPNDYDCLTHEFSHVIQNGWDGDYCEYSGYIERFADCCRYIYAFEDGKYNDSVWELQTVRSESTRESSVRFLVWLDYTYSTEDNDLLLKYFTACRSKLYKADNWDRAWQEIFKGTELEGMDIDKVFELYSESEFAKLSSKGKNGNSLLLKKYDIREKTK